MKTSTPLDPRAKQKIEPRLACTHCHKPLETCICSKITPIKNQLKVVILQHPQEKYKLLNSARLTHLVLPQSQLFVGLSWPNFKKVAGPEALPSEWAVLFLSPEKSSKTPITLIDRKKNQLKDYSKIKGIIALDGSWKQAKTLWWRNPWLLKCNRISLNLTHPSLRAQVRPEGLSTIEAVAGVFEYCTAQPEVADSLRSHYQNCILTL